MNKSTSPPFFTPSVTRLLKPVLWGMVMLCLLVMLGYIIVYSNFIQNQGILAELTTRSLAILDSLTSGLVFFLAIGLATFIASINRPEDDPLHLRLKYLFAGSLSANPKISKFLGDEVQKISAVCEKIHFDIVVREVYEGETQEEQNKTEGSKDTVHAIEIDVTARVQMNNLMKNELFIHQIPLNIRVDPFEGSPSSVLGELLYVFTPSEGQLQEIILESPTQVTETQPIITQLIDIEIPMNGTLEYQYRYRRWVKLSADHSNKWFNGGSNLQVNNFALETTFSVINESGKYITVKPFYEGSNDFPIEAIKLGDGKLDPKVFNLSDWYPEKIVELHWKYNRYGHNH